MPEKGIRKEIGMKADFHSHILPNFDDGAADEKTALEMIKASAGMGVDHIVSTSHCYPYSGGDITEFVRERNAAYSRLKAAVAEAGAELPDIRLGSEVHLTCDLSSLPGIEKLCIEGTRYMLLEMPSSKWSDERLDLVYKLTISGIKPIIAHMERNLGQKKELVEALLDLDVLVQINSSSFGVSSLKKELDRLFEGGLIHIIGTDMHNLDTRKPDMDRAEKYIRRRYGNTCWEYLMHNAELILGGEELTYRMLKSFKKKGLFR